MPTGMMPVEKVGIHVGVVDIVSKVTVNHNSHHPGKTIAENVTDNNNPCTLLTSA